MNRSPAVSLHRLAVILIGIVAAMALPVAKGSAMTLDEAKASEFFGWFHLAEVPGGTATTRLFRPDGNAFRALAAVELTTDAGARVVGTRLLVARSFIADPKIASFARDIAKSFLGFATSGVRAPALTSLADEIQFRDLTGQVLMRGDPPKLPAEPSAAYRVFAGTGDSATLAVPGTTFTFRNEMGGVPQVAITAVPAP